MRYVERFAEWIDRGGEWIARALIAVGAAGIAFSLVPWIATLKFVSVVAGAFALYQLFGFLMPKVRLGCRLGLAATLAFGLFKSDWIGWPVQAVFAKIALAFLVWSCCSLIVDVLEIPHADHWRDRKASMRKLGIVS